MKKYLTLTLVATGVLALAGCQKKEEPTSAQSSDKTEMTSSSTVESTQASSMQTSEASTQASTATEESKPATSNNNTGGMTITGLSGNQYDVALPEGWATVDGFESINPDADFLYGNQDQSRLISVISEPKADFADFDTYLDLVSKNIESTSGQKPTFKDLVNFKGKETEFSATVQGMNFNYIYYILETDKNFMQLYSWSFASDFDEAKPELVSIMDSFHVAAE